MCPKPCGFRQLSRPYVLIASAFLLMASQAAIGKDVRLSGSGTRKCSEWLEWKTAKNGEARAMALEWAMGFLAGHNIYARNGNEPANSVIADAMTLATLLDSYCQKHPENRVVAGVIDITQSLGGAKINMVPKEPPARPQKPNEAKSQTGI